MHVCEIVETFTLRCTLPLCKSAVYRTDALVILILYKKDMKIMHMHGDVSDEGPFRAFNCAIREQNCGGQKSILTLIRKAHGTGSASISSHGQGWRLHHKL